MNDPEKRVDRIADDFRIARSDMHREIDPLLEEIYKEGMKRILQESEKGFAEGKIWRQIKVGIMSKYDL